MIRHIALLQIPSHVPDAEINAMISQLEQAALKAPGMVAFCSGAKQPESMSQGFTHAITIDFVDAASRDIFVSELDHDRVGIRLSEMTEGGLGGILIMNISIDDIRTPEGGRDKKPELRWI